VHIKPFNISLPHFLYNCHIRKLLDTNYIAKIRLLYCKTEKKNIAIKRFAENQKFISLAGFVIVRAVAMKSYILGR
jgi:hypothetical protein